jgi:hypothetical protein
LRIKYPDFIINGCVAHSVNLLIKDICKLEKFEATLEKARFIIAFVTDKNALSKQFERIQSTLHEDEDLHKRLALVSVCESRWYTHHACVGRGLLTYVTNKSYNNYGKPTFLST